MSSILIATVPSVFANCLLYLFIIYLADICHIMHSCKPLHHGLEVCMELFCLFVWLVFVVVVFYFTPTHSQSNSDNPAHFLRMSDQSRPTFSETFTNPNPPQRSSDQSDPLSQKRLPIPPHS